VGVENISENEQDDFMGGCKAHCDPDLENYDPLAGGYRLMASDLDRETEAREWTKALIGDALQSEEE
jgi:hypothetical protein